MAFTIDWRLGGSDSRTPVSDKNTTTIDKNGVHGVGEGLFQGIKDYLGVGETTSTKLAKESNDIAREGTASAERMNKENIALQRELNNSQLAFARELNELAMVREDSAHQREIADMRRAGLSPYATMNGAGAGDFTMPSLSAPQNDIAGINGAVANQQSALGNQVGAIGQSIAQQQNRFSDTMSLLNYIQSETQLKHERGVDKAKLDLADKNYTLDKYKAENDVRIRDLEYELSTKKYNSEAERISAEIKLASEKAVSEQIQQAKTKLDMTIATDENKRSQAQHEYDMRIGAIEYSQAVHNLDESILTDSLKRKIMEINYKSDETQFEWLAKELKMEYSKGKSEAFRNYILGVAGALKAGADVANAVTSMIPGRKVGF